jgi:hypothetical protein
MISPFLATKLSKAYGKIKKKKAKGIKEGGTIMEGSWHGNNTLWRSILDLNNIIFFADKEGKIQKTKQRKYLTIIDGVIGTDGEGPMDGDPKESGIIIGGFHPVATDLIASKIMGFDYSKIPVIKNGLKERFFNLSNFREKDIKVNGNVNVNELNLKFKPSSGWRENIER